MNTNEVKEKRERIPLLDLKAQYRSIEPAVSKVMKRVVEDQNFIMGDDVRSLEKEIAAYCQTKFGIGVASGTDALILALKAIDIKDGDEVITTPFTFMATGGSISNAGARPVFCDIDPRTYNMDPKNIERCITKKTKAIMPVHLYGQCADMDKILKIARSSGLKVIEDDAQAIGATYKTRKSGSMGDVGCISFFPSKNLGAFGDGGMVVTNDGGLAEKISVLRLHGSAKRYIHSVIGTNSRLDNLQAAILRIKLKYLDEWTKKRQLNAEIYNKIFKGSSVVTPYVEPGNTHVYHQYVIKVPPQKREALIERLAGSNVESRVYYPIPLHLQECYKGLGYKSGDMPNSEDAAKSTLALPVYPELGEDNIAYIAGIVLDFLKEK